MTTFSPAFTWEGRETTENRTLPPTGTPMVRTSEVMVSPSELVYWQDKSRGYDPSSASRETATLNLASLLLFAGNSPTNRLLSVGTTGLFPFLEIFRMASLASSDPTFLISRTRYPSVPAFRCSPLIEVVSSMTFCLILTGRFSVSFISRYV
ncbi:MAG: hypothetical protein A4E42_01280 [Methanoregulaceae archaeon PtaU1.Bin222]|nr:MAG: hypothetical protein A4E42_01280 [Methanoregulaceae archaeon PtaU1.Bin222]